MHPVRIITISIEDIGADGITRRVFDRINAKDFWELGLNETLGECYRDLVEELEEKKENGQF